jgi:hypothetical protein
MHHGRSSSLSSPSAEKEEEHWDGGEVPSPVPECSTNINIICNWKKREGGSLNKTTGGKRSERWKKRGPRLLVMFKQQLPSYVCTRREKKNHKNHKKNHWRQMKRIFSRHAWADRYEVVVFVSFYCIRTISVLCSPLPTPLAFERSAD